MKGGGGARRRAEEGRKDGVEAGGEGRVERRTQEGPEGGSLSLSLVLGNDEFELWEQSMIWGFCRVWIE